MTFLMITLGERSKHDNFVNANAIIIIIFVSMIDLKCRISTGNVAVSELATLLQMYIALLL